MESDFLRWLGERLPSHPQLLLGPGDDAAVMRLAAGADCVVSSDMLMDGTDFLLDQCDPRWAGRKALAVNLSDLAAMAAQPLAAVVSAALPQENALELAKQLYEGYLPLAEEFQVALAGGDTNTWPHPLAISVTIFGETTTDGTLRRDGARPGDRLLATGDFGGSILGKHFHFTPRVREALELNARYALRAAADVSDGLSLDAWRIAKASGCDLCLLTEQIPIAKDAWKAADEGASREAALRRALGDGEDFELIFAAPQEEAERILREQPLETPISEVGYFFETSEPPKLWSEGLGKQREPMEPQGYRH